MSELRFDGQVAVITGAGAGLGRAYALLFASRGAKVVVNDLGGGRHGDGSSTNAADAVVEEIRKQGGTAVADYNSVVEGDRIIQTALYNFGKVDILVNNAGILRDKSFARISDQDWDLVHSVHLKGSFKTTQAAWPVFRKQGYGRIIMTSSNAGVYGNFGQANYSAAKMGLIGLANTIAIEGNKYNIHCNVIVPTAASRLTEDILPTEMFVELKPELIAPVVAYLCHESCDDNGVVIDSAMGWAAKYHIIRSQGSLLRESKGMPVTIENVRDSWPRVTDMTKTAHFDSIQEASASLMTVFSAENKEENEPFIYTSKDLILYALGIGVSIVNPSNLQYLYENHEDFKPFPSFFVIPGLMQVMQSSITAEALPHASVSPANVLHGEQYLEIVGDLPTEGSLDTQCTVVDVLDKGSGAVVIIDAESYNRNTGEMVVKSQVSTFVVGAGGFRGPRSSSKSIPTIDPPRRGPDAVITQKTTLDQAALYRLSGDVNPLHIDPNMAVMAGYKKPILHGLCTLGFSIKHVIEQYAGNDGSLFKAYKVRFAKPVMPGETLKTEMWKDGNRIYFQTSVVETNTAVIKGGYVDLKSTMPAVSTRSVSASNLKSDVVFEKITEGLKADPAKAKSVNAVFVYNITKNGKHAKKWTLDLKTAQIYEGEPKGDKANTTLTISDEDMLDIALGKLNPQSAFMKGKLKISGNIMLTQKLVPLLKSGAKL